MKELRVIRRPQPEGPPTVPLSNEESSPCTPRHPVHRVAGHDENYAQIAARTGLARPAAMSNLDAIRAGPSTREGLRSERTCCLVFKDRALLERLPRCGLGEKKASRQRGLKTTALSGYLFACPSYRANAPQPPSKATSHSSTEIRLRFGFKSQKTGRRAANDAPV